MGVLWSREEVREGLGRRKEEGEDVKRGCRLFLSLPFRPPPPPSFVLVLSPQEATGHALPVISPVFSAFSLILEMPAEEAMGRHQYAVAYNTMRFSVINCGACQVWPFVVPSSRSTSFPGLFFFELETAGIQKGKALGTRLLHVV